MFQSQKVPVHTLKPLGGAADMANIVLRTTYKEEVDRRCIGVRSINQQGHRRTRRMLSSGPITPREILASACTPGPILTIFSAPEDPS